MFVILNRFMLCWCFYFLERSSACKNTNWLVWISGVYVKPVRLWCYSVRCTNSVISIQYSLVYHIYLTIQSVFCVSFSFWNSFRHLQFIKSYLQWADSVGAVASARVTRPLELTVKDGKCQLRHRPLLLTRVRPKTCISINIHDVCILRQRTLLTRKACICDTCTLQ